MIKTRLFPDIMRGSSFSGKDIQRAKRGELGNILELRTGYGCNNNCNYCPVAQKRHLGERTTEQCKHILKDNRQDRNLLIISGGEPTIRKDIFNLVAYAKDLDYQWIQLQTNGRAFRKKGFAKKMVKVLKKHPVSGERREIDDYRGYNFNGLDIFEFYVSVLGHNSELHDSITGVPGSFNETIRGIKNLLELEQIVGINVVINKLNYKYLPEIVTFLEGSSARYIELSFVDVAGSALANFEDVVPTISEVKESLSRLPQQSRRKSIGYKRLIKSIPSCCFRGSLGRPSELFYPYDRHMMYKLADFDETLTYHQKQTKNNIKKEECGYCIYEAICYGINRNYAQRLGFGELTPVLGNRAGDLVEKEKAEQFENLENIKLPDLKFEFDDPKLRVDFGSTKADVISLLSGGVDSSSAAAVYAKNNPDKKVVLVTFSDCYSPGAEGARVNAGYLMEKYSNIINHFIVSIPYILSKKFVLSEMENDYKRLNYYPGCVRCKYLRLAYCVYLLKKYFGGDTVISGHREGEAARKKHEERFFNKYSIKVELPIFNMNKEETIKFAEEEGLAVAAARQHSLCLIGNFKSRLKKIGFSMDLFCQSREKELQELLKSNGIPSNSL